MTEIRPKKTNYSYGYAKAQYAKLEKYEISMQIPTINDEESLIIRLDGKGLTSRFKNNKELFLSDFYLAMRRILENIQQYCPYVKFAYSFKDELSLLIDNQYTSHNKHFQNRVEKVLPIISGYTSSMFSQYIPNALKSSPTESFTFDARIVIIPTSQLKTYFHSRQAFAMSNFIDRICSFKSLALKNRTLNNVKAALKERNDDWHKYPQYVYCGYVGCFEDGKWRVDTASDFAQKWQKYETLIK